MSGLTTFGGRLEAALKLRRVGKMYALAVAIGVDESAISRWRRGKAISTENLIKLCDALDLSVDWLLTGRGAMQAAEAGQWHDQLACTVAALDPCHAHAVAELLRLLGDACEKSGATKMGRGELR